MATPLLQKARQRKMIYFGAIVVLFTLSLMHRKFILEPQALQLQLREVSRGEVELTSSAVRLMLTGSRGLAVTMLWYTAMDRQKRNEWHELELLVKSITKLQPYFITPWLYQSWNISFNVAVECDKPRDKYYYISRGIELLGEGERRNRGTDDPNPDKRITYPGNPEMRHYMGFWYQLKMGTSDERLTMRCLLEMSCIDPIERNPDRFLERDAQGKETVNLEKFAQFCQNHPRLVRRLREQLGHEQPLDIMRFLKDHMTIPNRFQPPRSPTAKESELKPVLQQFPVLPPREGHWPNPESRDMTNESIDVFLMCRTWYEFAQKPLPPPDPNPGPGVQDYDKHRFRIPKQMVTQLFRQYPPRAQIYIAETLESEGFFDSDGWRVPRWFEKLEARDSEDTFTVGKESKYHSREAWDKGFEMYREFGRQNGIYLSPTEIADLNRKADRFRKEARKGKPIDPEEMPGEIVEWRDGDKGVSGDAHKKLYYSRYYQRLTNFNAFYYQAEGERDPITVAARKRLFTAERNRKREAWTVLTLAEYERAWPLYLHACLKYPKFAQVSSMQEDFYEIYQNYLHMTQKLDPEPFRQTAILAAKLPLSTPPNWLEIAAKYNLVSRKEEDRQLMLKAVPIKKRTGELDEILFYVGPRLTEDREFPAHEFRDFLFLWTQGANVAMNMSYAATITYPDQADYLLLRRTADVDAEIDPRRGWLPLILPDTRRITAGRLGLDR